MRDLQTVDLGDLIPPSIANDPQVQAAVQALNSELQACTAQIEQTVLIARIDELDSDTLDQLAWHYNVLFYSTGYTLSQKRGAIKQAIYWRRIAGTKAAVVGAIESIGYGAIISEWYQHAGIPYTFKIDVEVVGLPIIDETWEKAQRIVDATKNTRSHYAMRVAAKLPGVLHLAAATIAGEETVVYPYNPGAAGVTGQLYYAAACVAVETVEVRPQA
jgi:phage tail P2-like protein